MTVDNSSSLVSKKGGKLFQVPSVLYVNRYCNQNESSTLVCGGTFENNFNASNHVYELKVLNFECSKFSSMLEARYASKSVVINSDIVVTGGYKGLNPKVRSYTVQSFNTNNKLWSRKTELTDNRDYFCICACKQNLYIIAGRNKFGKLKSCFVYNMKRDRWSQIADMNEKRTFAACTIYEGKIAVTGGIGFNDNYLKSVEAYDYYENKWTYLPDMNDERRCHASVSMGNKLFVICGVRKSTCEIFDSFSRKFSFIKTCSEFTNDMGFCQAVCISNCIIIFSKVFAQNQIKVFTYNDDTDEWQLIDCSFLKNKYGFSCVKYHE